MRKCPGVRVSILSSSHGLDTSGRLFKQASTCVRIVVSSSNVSFTSEITRLRWVFILLTAASHKPLKFGARSEFP